MPNKPIQVLIIEDQLEDAYIERRLLEPDTFGRFEVVHAESLASGLKILDQGGIDIVLLDLFLPDSRGEEGIDTVKKHAHQTPIIVLTGGTGSTQDIEIGLSVIRRGAQEYLIKGEASGALLKRLVRHAIERHRLAVEQEPPTAPLPPPPPPRPVSPPVILTDPQTGLYDSLGFMTLARHQLNVGNQLWVPIIVIAIAIEGMKGSSSAPDAEERRIRMADILKKVFRESDIIGRIGEDRFSVLAFDPEGTYTSTVMDNLRKMIEAHNLNRTNPLIVRIGIARYDPLYPCSINDLMARAERDQ